MTSEWLDYSCSLADLTFDIAFYEHECIKNMAYEVTFGSYVCILGFQTFEASFIEFICVLIEEVTTTTTEIQTTTTTEPIATTTTTTEEIVTTTTTAEVTTTTTTQGIYPVEYGALYNWYAATDVRNIAASGWHVSTKADFSAIRAYTDPSGTDFVNTSSGKLKETGTVYWFSPNTGATNETNFNSRGSGTREPSGFGYLMSTTWYWTTTELNASYSWYARIESSNTLMYINSYTKNYGFSIRLVKDTTTLTHGQTGTYTGNDGKIYRTICIGTQEWVADNLLETKYRNGDWITGYDGGVYTPISNAAWAAKTTEAMCFHNDLESNG
jgi:uncharacterized protein (TIGR02145 family)